MLYRVLNSIKESGFFEYHETEEIVSVMPMSRSGHAYLYSMLTQHREKPEFAVWVWNEEKKDAMLIEAGIKDIDLAMYMVFNETAFIDTMHKAHILNEYKKLYGSVMFKGEEYIYVDEPNLVQVRDTIAISTVEAIRKSEIPINGMIKIQQIVFEKDGTTINHIKPARRSGDIYIMNMFNGERFADSKPLYGVFSRIVMKAPFADDKAARSCDHGIKL